MTEAPCIPPLTGDYEEIDVSPEVWSRLYAVAPCGSPFCSCRLNPRLLFVYSEADADRFVAGTMAPEDMARDLVASLGPEDVRVMVTNSILFGVPLRFFQRDGATGLNQLIERQKLAHKGIPAWFWDRPHEELCRLREVVHELDPAPVTALLQLQIQFGLDVGGSRGG